MRASPLALFAFALTCCRTPSPPEKHPTPTTASAATSASSTASQAAAGSALPAWQGDGCQAGVDASRDPKAVLGALAAACAPGMKRLGEPTRIAPADGGPGLARFRIEDADGCVRVLGVADPSTAHVELGLLDAEGRELSSSTAPGALAVVGPKGPVCPSQSGELRVVARGAGALVEVWQAPSARDE